jgi:hypothetical protein
MKVIAKILPHHSTLEIVLRDVASVKIQSKTHVLTQTKARQTVVRDALRLKTNLERQHAARQRMSVSQMKYEGINMNTMSKPAVINSTVLRGFVKKKKQGVVYL